MADNRENTLLQAIAEGETVDDARTSDEVFLKAIADGAEKPEEIRNHLQYWLNQIDGGGGNPNYVETITGTLETVFAQSQQSYSELSSLYSTDQITAYITVAIPGFAEGGSVRAILSDVVNTGATVRRRAFFQYAVSEEQALLIAYNHNKVLLTAYSLYKSDLGEITSADPATTCTLTIIHHPMPTT